MKHIVAKRPPDSSTRYVFNFYLPKKLYSIVVPTDIFQIYTSFGSDDIGTGKAETVEIEYPQLKGAKKIGPKEAVKLILNAWDSYYQKRDIKYDLSPAEFKAVLAMNETMHGLENIIVGQCLRLHEEIEGEKLHGNDFITGSELDVKIGFISDMTAHSTTKAMILTSLALWLKAAWMAAVSSIPLSSKGPATPTG